MIHFYRMMNSIVNSYVKELKNADNKKVNNEILVDTGLNIIGEKIKKGISSITGSRITLTNNEIKDIMKIIKSLESKEIFLKGTARQITS